MAKYLSLLFISVFLTGCKESPNNDSGNFITVFEQSNGKKTATYEETIKLYTDLSNAYETIALTEIATTDAGYPLHLVTFSPEKNFDFEKLQQEKAIFFINNGIHPGEPDGIDATMLLMRDLAQGKIDAPENTVISAIAIYNIGGAINRNSTSRTNQSGPEAYGFRGNARNYDLNRDFIKSDTKNSRAFAEIFHMLNPDMFIDTHVSNGADYQYVLTHLFTQHNKLGGDLGPYVNNILQPELEKSLAKKNWEITPYVNVFNRPPDSGFTQFMDYPRYSTGYTALFNTPGLMIETHMLKPYKERVEGTYALLHSMINITDGDYQKIKKLRKAAVENYSKGKEYPVTWEIDSSRFTEISFKGYEAKYTESEITGKQRLLYDRDQPFTKPVVYYNYYKPVKKVTIPTAYGIPQGWWEVVDLLKKNRIKMHNFEKDTVISAEVYTIEDYDTGNAPYEGHYSHYNTEVSSKTEEVSFRKGDFIVYTNQPGVRYLLETLEPEATDSFFNWNFFDTVLQQKEGFSPYVFEEIAENLLEENEELRKEFENKKAQDEKFRENWYAQLDWLHKNSKYYEEAHMRYPVYRILN